MGKAWTYMAELWGTPDGQIYYKLDNWHGFYHAIPNVKQEPGDRVSEPPADAVLLLKDGEWLPGSFQLARLISNS